MHVTKKCDDLIYDVGMHKGEDTDFYLKKGFRVIGFEADPDLAEHCRRRFAQEIQDRKLIIVEGAIVEQRPAETAVRTVKFFKNQIHSVWGTVLDDWAHRNETLGTQNTAIEVNAVNFEQCLREYGIPHYLKVDIEGMDTVCLRALLDFEQRPDYVSMESEKVRFGKLAEELTLLTQLGYSRFKAVQQVGISSQVEPKLTREGSYVGYRFEEGSSGLFGDDLPQKWRNHQQTLSTYKRIYVLYALFGDYGKLKGALVGRILKKVLSVLWRKPSAQIPGWYDTHAKHSSIPF